MAVKRSVPIASLPVEVRVEDAVEMACAEDVTFIEERLRRGMSVLVECDKELALHVYLAVRGRLRRSAGSKERAPQIVIVDGRPREGEDDNRGTLARIAEEGRIENIYRLQIMNATEATQKYRITAEGLPGLAIASENVVTVDSTQAVRLAVRVQAPYDVAAPGTHPIRFEIESMRAPGHLIEKSMFMVPR